MEQRFNVEELTSLSEGELIFILSEQNEAFRHIQNQARSILGAVVGIVALLISFMGSEIVRTISNLKIYTKLSSIPALFTNDFVTTSPELVEGSYFVAFMFVFLSAVFVLDGTIGALSILGDPKPLPTSPTKTTRIFENMEVDRSTDLKSWISTNEKRISRVQLDLERAYALFYYAAVTLMFALSIAVLTAIGYLPILVIFHIIAIALFPVVSALYLRDTIIKLVSEWKSNGFRNAISASLDEYGFMIRYVGPNAALKTALIIVGSTYFPYSWDIINFYIANGI